MSAFPSLGIRPLGVEYLRHPRHDPGCFLQAPDILQPYQLRAAHALVVFDREGCGREELTAEQIESDLATRLSESGWGPRSRAVAIDPESEIWIWSDSPKVDEGLGWANRKPALREWLRSRQLLAPDPTKPGAPKDAFRVALREVGQKASASVFARLARQVSLDRCDDPSFSRLRSCLTEWFGTGA